MSNTYVVLPANGLEGDGVDVLVEDKGDRDREVEHVVALCTEREWEDLERVRNDERRECKATEDSLATRQRKHCSKDALVEGVEQED